MLACEATIKVVAAALRDHNISTSVVDPVSIPACLHLHRGTNLTRDQVMVSTSGSQLLQDEALETLIRELLPVTTILTPNFPEAQLILEKAGKKINTPQTVAEIIEVAKAVQALGPKYVLLKGGHVPLTKDRRISSMEDQHALVYNVLCTAERVTAFETEYINSKSTHGTGCSLACALIQKHSNIAY